MASKKGAKRKAEDVEAEYEIVDGQVLTKQEADDRRLAKRLAAEDEKTHAPAPASVYVNSGHVDVMGDNATVITNTDANGNVTVVRQVGRNNSVAAVGAAGTYVVGGNASVGILGSGGLMINGYDTAAALDIAQAVFAARAAAASADPSKTQRANLGAARAQAAARAASATAVAAPARQPDNYRGWPLDSEQAIKGQAKDARLAALRARTAAKKAQERAQREQERLQREQERMQREQERLQRDAARLHSRPRAFGAAAFAPGAAVVGGQIAVGQSFIFGDPELEQFNGGSYICNGGHEIRTKPDGSTWIRVGGVGPYRMVSDVQGRPVPGAVAAARVAPAEIKTPDEAKDEEAKEGQSTCGICLTNVKHYACMPCGHLFYCNECARKTFPKGTKAGAVTCPECRKPVDAIQRVFS